MKKAYILFVILVIVTIFPLSVTGCNGEGSVQDTTAEEPQSTETQQDTIIVFENGATRYSIIWPTGPSEFEYNASTQLASAFSKCGVNIKHNRDYIGKDGSNAPTDYEILIGRTNREESIDINKTLKSDDYVISSVNTKIVITGGSPAATMKAAQRFIAEYLPEGTTSLSLKDICLIEKGVYPVSDFYINGTSITEFVIVRGISANAIDKYAANLLCDTIKERTGAVLEIVNDSAKASEHEIRVGKTNRSGGDPGDCEYIIRADGGSLVLGGGLYSVTAVVNAFINTYLPESSESAVRVSIGGDATSVSTKNNPLPSEPTLDGKRLIALCDQLGGTVTVIDLDAPDPTSSSAVVWNWKPTTALGFASTSGYNNYIDEAVLRYSELHGSYVMCVTSSSGFMAVVEYPSGKCLWAGSASGFGPHAIEYLPDGNVAVACSGNSNIDQGCVRIYTSSQGKVSGRYINIPLKSAHGVVWDDKNQLLWVLGYDTLEAYRITGTAKEPVATKVPGLGGTLPAAGGHNLSVSEADPDILWISSGSVFQYRKSTGTFITLYEGQSSISTSSVKSVDSFADGTVIRAKATNVFKAHNTDTLTVITFDAAGNAVRTDYIFPNRAFYKARRLGASYSAY